jgi:hypothetical protein
VGIAIVLASFTLYVMRALLGKRNLHITSLDGLHVFITGGSSGIGLALASQALLEGAYVTLTGRNASTLKNAVASLSEEIIDSAHRIQMKVFLSLSLPWWSHQYVSHFLISNLTYSSGRKREASRSSSNYKGSCSFWESTCFVLKTRQIPTVGNRTKTA